eukprot:gene3103-2085_t
MDPCLGAAMVFAHVLQALMLSSYIAFVMFGWVYNAFMKCSFVDMVVVVLQIGLYYSVKYDCVSIVCYTEDKLIVYCCGIEVWWCLRIIIAQQLRVDIFAIAGIICLPARGVLSDLCCWMVELGFVVVIWLLQLCTRGACDRQVVVKLLKVFKLFVGTCWLYFDMVVYNVTSFFIGYCCKTFLELSNLDLINAMYVTSALEVCARLRGVASCIVQLFLYDLLHLLLNSDNIDVWNLQKALKLWRGVFDFLGCVLCDASLLFCCGSCEICGCVVLLVVKLTDDDVQLLCVIKVFIASGYFGCIICFIMLWAYMLLHFGDDWLLCLVDLSVFWVDVISIGCGVARVVVDDALQLLWFVFILDGTVVIHTVFNLLVLFGTRHALIFCVVDCRSIVLLFRFVMNGYFYALWIVYYCIGLVLNGCRYSYICYVSVFMADMVAMMVVGVLLLAGMFGGNLCFVDLLVDHVVACILRFCVCCVDYAIIRRLVGLTCRNSLFQWFAVRLISSLRACMGFWFSVFVWYTIMMRGEGLVSCVVVSMFWLYLYVGFGWSFEVWHAPLGVLVQLRFVFAFTLCFVFLRYFLMRPVRCGFTFRCWFAGYGLTRCLLLGVALVWYWFVTCVLTCDCGIRIS